MRILVSACLMGKNCKYNGGNNYNQEIIDFCKAHEVIEVCPEVEGGLPVPRIPVELRNGIAYMQDGKNVNKEFQCGTEKILERIKGKTIDLAILQSRSPSCGSRQIYDGTFSRHLIDGQGVFAKAVMEKHIPIMESADFSRQEAEKMLMKNPIRPAEMKDLEAILSVYEAARTFMKEHGNPDQWGNTYPPSELVIQDIQEKKSYVITDEKDVIHGVFMFFDGKDPDYDSIDGVWKNEEAYGVIHRVANDGSIKGILAKAVEYCSQRCPNLKMDTHKDNLVMQHVLEKNGFEYCGIVHLKDGSTRMAYQRCR